MSKLTRMKMGLLSGVLCLAGLAPAWGDTMGVPPGQPAPNFIGRTLDGQAYRLKADVGRPKVINFFAITCRPCAQEMPELAALARQFPGVEFISVNTADDDPASVKKFLATLPAAPTNIVLTSGGLQEIIHYPGLPHTLALDRDNVVQANFSGYTPDNIRHLRAMLPALAGH